MRGMASTQPDLIETTTDGPKTRRWVVEACDCAEMSTHRIARLGMDEALPPYRRGTGRVPEARRLRLAGWCHA